MNITLEDIVSIYNQILLSNNNDILAEFKKQIEEKTLPHTICDKFIEAQQDRRNDSDNKQYYSYKEVYNSMYSKNQIEKEYYNSIPYIFPRKERMSNNKTNNTYFLEVKNVTKYLNNTTLKVNYLNMLKLLNNKNNILKNILKNIQSNTISEDIISSITTFKYGTINMDSHKDINKLCNDILNKVKELLQ